MSRMLAALKQLSDRPHPMLRAVDPLSEEEQRAVIKNSLAAKTEPARTPDRLESSVDTDPVPERNPRLDKPLLAANPAEPDAPPPRAEASLATDVADSLRDLQSDLQSESTPTSEAIDAGQANLDSIDYFISPEETFETIEQPQTQLAASEPEQSDAASLLQDVADVTPADAETVNEAAIDAGPPSVALQETLSAVRPEADRREAEPGAAPAGPMMSAAVWRLRDAIQARIRQGQPHVVVFASVDAAADRQQAIASLGRALAGGPMGRVLLVDAAFIPSDLPSLVGAKNPPLFDHFPAQLDELADAVLPSDTAGLEILACSHAAAATSNFDATVDSILLTRWKRHYPLILIDAGTRANPLLLPLARQADAVYVTVGLGSTHRMAADQLVRHLSRDGARVLGAIVTGAA